jgi:hypothetical protein
MQQSSASLARAEVELDIYSGMPNPTWALSNEDASTLATSLASLPRTSDQRLHANLGYRGFIIRLTQGTTAQEVRVQSGIVQVAERGGLFYARDNSRALERWLLTTGRAYVKPERFEELERQLR